MTGRIRGGLIRSIAVALVALAASFGVAACGGSGGGDQDKVKAVAEHLRDANAAVCGELTDAYLKKLFKDKATCEKQAKASNAKNSFDIKDVKVNGDKATVNVQAKKTKGTILLVKQGGDWKIETIKAG